MLLSYSKIPDRYMEPLNIETRIEYSIDTEKFPGLQEVNGEPTLVVAESGELETGNQQCGDTFGLGLQFPSLTTTDAGPPSQSHRQTQQQAEIPTRTAQYDQTCYTENFCYQPSVQRRLTFESSPPRPAKRHCSEYRNPGLSDTAPQFVRPSSPPIRGQPNCSSTQALSCLDPFDDAFSTTRNDGTSISSSTPASIHNASTSANTSTQNSGWARTTPSTTTQSAPPRGLPVSRSYGHLPVTPVHYKVPNTRLTASAPRGQVEIYGVEARVTSAQQQPQGFHTSIHRAEKRPLPEENVCENFDEYSCPPKKPNAHQQHQQRPQRRHTVHYYGRSAPAPNKPVVTQRPTARRQKPFVPPPNVDISKLLIKNPSTNHPSRSRVMPHRPGVTGRFSSQVATNQMPRPHLPIGNSVMPTRPTTHPATHQPFSNHVVNENVPHVHHPIRNNVISAEAVNSNHVINENAPPVHHPIRNKVVSAQALNSNHVVNENAPPVHHPIRNNVISAQAVNSHVTYDQARNLTKNVCAPNQHLSSNQRQGSCVPSFPCQPINTCVTNDTFLDILHANWRVPLDTSNTEN